MTINAKIIADSTTHGDKRITTFELEYPRFIHSELMTHRVFSRNAASSRAIPVARTIELIKDNTAMPVHWGKNRPGMSANEENNATFFENKTREDVWGMARDAAINFAAMFNDKQYHKQIINRLLEPFSHMKTIVTSTEYDNWFALRNHKDAQPEIHMLAKVMFDVYNDSAPNKLTTGEWHVPYYNNGRWSPVHTNSVGVLYDVKEYIVDEFEVTLADALAISSSCCAQVSYRRLNDSMDKACEIYNRLVESFPPHFSPFEHQASPMPDDVDFSFTGVTHLDKYGKYWSGNFNNWIQHRQLIMNALNVSYMSSNFIKEKL